MRAHVCVCMRVHVYVCVRMCVRVWVLVCMSYYTGKGPSLITGIFSETKRFRLWVGGLNSVSLLKIPIDIYPMHASSCRA